MKLTRLTQVAILVLVLGIAATGCRKRPYDVSDIKNPPLAHVQDAEPQPPLQPLPTEPPISATPQETPLTPLNETDLHHNWIENPEIFKSFIVHFAYDSSAVRTSEKSKVSSVADYLKSNQRDAVRVEGHCDERGTEEYNRSLGERRALALREELIRLGIDSTRVDTLSYGEDRPVASGHDESAWRQNRRGEFILLSPPQ